MIDEHSRQIASSLSESLAALEIRSTAVPKDVARRAILETWMRVIGDVEQGRANVSSPYLAKVHQMLVTLTGVPDQWGFVQDGMPLLPDGRRTSWDQFAEDCRLNEPDRTEEYALPSFAGEDTSRRSRLH